MIFERGWRDWGKIIGREKGSSRARGERLRGIFCADFLRREGSGGF